MEAQAGSAGLILVTWLAILLGAFVVLYLVLQRNKLPPGPFVWPVVGSLPALNGDLPHRTLHKLARKYGGLMFLRLGSVPTIVISSAAVSQEFFQNHDAIFLDRPKIMVHHIMTFRSDSSLATSSGLYWRQLRKFCASEMFTAKRQASHQGIRVNEIHMRIKELIADSQQGKTAINMKSWVMGVTSNNITRMLVNKRFFGRGSENCEEKEQFSLVTSSISDILRAFVISDYVPYLGFVSKLQGWEKRIEDLRTHWFNLVEKVFEIENHKQRAKERPVDDQAYVPDFVDVLLQTPFNDEETLPDRNILLVLSDMMLAGTESSATFVEWALAELMLKPDIMQRLHHELDTVVGTARVVQEVDLPNLPFLQNIVKETLRLHVGLNIPHEATQAFEFRGYKFPKKTRLLHNLFAIHRDPSVYDHPDEFNPDRFLARPDLNHLSGFDSYELTPFGAGRRMCPGFSLGNLMVTATLAHLVHSFDWALPDGACVDMNEQYGLAVNMKTPLELIATPRPPAFLY